ncbi:centrosomin isoform X2 [Culex quinquefasciatus]|uniref:centrosomin isoform X2 n=1 Tax=Culex quinquefasciatus TaxID=7176 RepID=UPI0018E3C926|nr:centrosomin isoform X2 [Culex quinquefasciatus]XP_038116314.1 centrosomin isoform X2 [Culex quinquefasciatus]XP_038116315.1 centrosomin isoform X2 [Culex quinquefasciatus]XP_038116316.1 centrosomin isoform X2 [Culex quinquefasciatus]
MSGIFKYTPNRAAASTPNRRSAFGVTGFGGSPSHQNDATMDNSYSMGFRSPSMSALAGQTSPAQGRSLREYEEQMSALRKENFNLKLRIYFLEENAGLTAGHATSPTTADGNTSGGTPESLIKQNIDLKVELESLRKDLQEKQDLLLQAGKAMDLMEESSRKAQDHNREIIDDLEHRLELLHHEIKQMEQAERQQQQQANMTRSRLNETGLLDFLERMDHRELNVQDKLQALEMDSVVRQCHEQNEELCRKIGELHQQLEERELKIGALEAEVNDLRFECAELKDKLEENGKSTSDAEIMRLKKDLFAAKSDLADKLCQLDDTEVKLREKTAEHVQACKVVEKLCKTIPELEKEISRLKRNSNPDPNPKEAVAKKIVSDPGNPAKNAPIVDENQQPVTQDEYDAVVQRLRALQKKNESLIAKLTGGSTDRNENIIIKQLNEELIQARDETDKAQRWRKDCMDLCAISTARLEELAGFLDSLLRNKEFSGSLPVDRRKAMRKAVDRSLDLSRSLNMSISVTGFSLPESSLAHLSCLSGYLDAGEDSLLEANKENRADESVGSVAKVIETLKAENRELRGQLAGHNKKDVRRKIIPALAEPLSDSEAWSEPDRDVSQARIGLEERTSLPNSASKVKSVVTRGGVLQELSSTSENENVGYLKKHTAELKQLQETVGTLTGALQEKDSKILDVQSRLVDLDNKLQEERMKASRMQAELENTRQVNQRLEKENGVQQDRSKTNEKRLEELTREIQQKDEVLEKLRKEREQAFVDLRVAVMKLDNLRTEHQEVQQKHKDQIETLLAQERQRLEDLRRDLSESFNSQLKAKQASFEASLSESYISKNIHQEKLQELQEVMFRLDDTEMQLLGMSEDQARLKKQLQDAETAVQSMRKTLDETTLQASKAAIERTKALNEKRQLEDELKHCQDDLRATKEEKNALNAKLQEIQGQLQLATQQRTPPKRLNSSSGAEGSIASGYTSEELLLVAGRPAKPERTSRPENSSPDLGIESDAGRHSHTESQAPPPAPSPSRPLLKTLELTRSMSNLLMEPKEEAIQELNPTSATTTTPPHDCAKIEADYAELKRRYKQTRRHLELAYDSIKSANRRKERLEQDIKQQIQKTNVVLKTVRTNMTNELEKSPSGGEVRKSVP